MRLRFWSTPGLKTRGVLMGLGNHCPDRREREEILLSRKACGSQNCNAGRTEFPLHPYHNQALGRPGLGRPRGVFRRYLLVKKKKSDCHFRWGACRRPAFRLGLVETGVGYRSRRLPRGAFPALSQNRRGCHSFFFSFPSLRRKRGLSCRSAPPNSAPYAAAFTEPALN